MYKYNKGEIEILEKCIRFLTPLKHNKIRLNINNFNPNELEIANYRSVSKVAFDKNASSLIQVEQLDYHTLETLKGPLTFVEGMQKLSFKGTRQVKIKKPKSSSISCTSAVYLKFFGSRVEKIKEMNTMYYEEKIPLNHVKGIVYGPHSISFKQFMRMNITNTEMQNIKFDQWRFVSVITNDRSFDFIIKSRQETLDIIVSIYFAMSLSMTDQYNCTVAQIKLAENEEVDRMATLKKEENKYKALSD